jgi:diaminohydroxyphosphoribosylaminopyrimidine deaminase/5-amino-6-(5-phosphoribosylamino)uracil reductase
MSDPNPDVAGGGAAHIEGRGVEVLSGVLERECRCLNQAFIKYVTTGIPYVILKAAATLDGFIGTSCGDSKWITNESSRRFAHRLRSLGDAVVVGIGTVLADDPMLTVRLPGKRVRRQPVRIVLDTKLQLSLESQLVRSAAQSSVWAVCGSDAPVEKETAMKGAGVEVIRADSRSSGIEIAPLLKELGKRRISSMLVEGGSRVLGAFLESGFSDEFHFFYAPKILADPDGIGMLTGRSRLKIGESIPAHGIRTRRFGDDVLVSGRLRELLY